MKSKIPEGTEFFPDDSSLARRLGLSVRESTFLCISGQLKEAGAKHDGRYFRTEDLDRIQTATPITQGERQQLYASRILADFRRQERDWSGPGGPVKLQLKAIRKAEGVLSDVVAMQSGIQATGRYAFVDRDGRITEDPARATGKLAIWTDSASLDSLLCAARAAGGTVRSATDHRTDFSGRLGHADNFHRSGDKVLCDVHLLQASPHRKLVLEAAASTPGLLALSAAGDATFALRDGRAYLRFESLSSLDLVGEGAVTRSLFD